VGSSSRTRTAASVPLIALSFHKLVELPDVAALRYCMAITTIAATHTAADTPMTIFLRDMAEESTTIAAIPRCAEWRVRDTLVNRPQSP
jgi:hypothetical protein